MTTTAHRIGRQVLELSLPRVEGAAALQEEAALPFRQGSSEIERLFDGLAGPGETLRVERLEIDLGELRGADWREQLVSRLVDRLRSALGGRAEGEPGEAPAVIERRGPPAAARFPQFLFFLERGRLPWWGRRPSRSWRQSAPAPRDAAERRALGELLRRDRRARRRLVLTVGDSYLAARVSELAGLAGCRRALAELGPAAGGGAARRRWRREFWLATLELAVAGAPDAARGGELAARLLALARARARPQTRAPAAARDHASPGATAPTPPELPEPWRGWLEAAGEEEPPKAADLLSAAWPAAAGRKPDSPAPAHGQEDAETFAAAPHPAPTPQAGEALPAGEPAPAGGARPASRMRELSAAPGAPDLPTEPSAGPSGLPEPEVAPAAAVSEREVVYLEGAGVVILHPFLNELFASRELLAGRRFRDEAARAAAVRLVAHLGYGSADVPEHDLLLPKLLCAMDWREPLETEELEAADRTACDELLTAVLGHWTALKSSSPEWLRDQFFRRQGKLEPVDDGWKLTVERQAQDVLLARLPWGLGMICLPWMKELLYVSWAE